MKYLLLLLTLICPTAFASCFITPPGQVEFLFDSTKASTYAYLEYAITCDEEMSVTLDFPNASPNGQVALVGSQSGFELPIYLRHAQSFEVVGSMANNEQMSFVVGEGMTTVGIEATLHFDASPQANDYSTVIEVRLIY